MEPQFALRVYAEDFSQSTAQTLSIGFDGAALPYPVSFMVERRSDENIFRRWTAAVGGWSSRKSDSPEFSVPGPLPQWDPATGKMEACVPLSTLMGNGTVVKDQAYLILTLAHRGPGAETWVDDGKVLVHYRWSRPDQAWIYGNIEQ